MRPTAPSLLDSVQGLATLKAFGQSAARGRFLAEKAHDLFRSTMWVLASNSASRGITDAGIAVGAAAALGIGAARMAEGAIGIEVLLIVLMMGVEVFRPMRDLRALLHTGMLGRAAAASLFRLLDTRPAIEDADGAADAASLAPTLAFEDVHFAYPGGRRPAHDGLSFSVGAGERVGIVGASGAGKSTILRLLMRFDDPQRGRVLLGGQDLRTLDRAALRARFGVVNQDTYLFHGTAAENIRFGKPDASDAEIEAAARAANAHGFIARLPQGYDTVIGERGIRLSGGQRQRIAIARALLRDAPILLLDEALSSVDAENEAVIQDALGRLMGGRTVLIMAHRLSSVIDADRILVLDEGRVVESGRHADLMAKRGVYHRLMADQVREGLDAPPPAVRPGAEPAIEPTTEDRRLAAAAMVEPADEVLRAEGLGWWGAWMRLLGLVRPFRGRVNLAFGLGVARVMAFIGVGVLSALVVAGLKLGTPVGGLLIALYAIAPLAGLLHWLESWVAHDMAFRLLTEMRIALYDKLDRLAPAYLLRRRTGDIVGMATQDVELVEYFFAHTVAPALVAILVPAAVVATLLVYGWPTAAALAPFILLVGLSPFFLRKRLDRLGGRAREMLGLLNAHAVDTIQGLTELLAFGQQGARRKVFLRYRAGPPPRAHPLLPRPHVPDGADRDGDRPRRACRGDGRHGLDRRRLAGGGDAAAARDPRHGDLPAGLRDRPHRPATGGHAGCHAAPQCRAQRAGQGGGRARREPRTGRGGAGDGGRELHLRGHQAAGAQRRHAHGPPRRDAGAGGPLRRGQDHHRPPLHALLGSGGGHGAAGRRRRAPVDARCAPRPHRAGGAGHLPLQRHAPRQHPHRPAGSLGGRA